jgi:DNA polymerase I-like protein with 3'-5' exonuclease and polymerase domains
MLKLALHDLQKYIEGNNLKSKIIMTVHDEIVVEIHDSEVHLGEAFGVIIRDAGSFFLKGVEMEVDWHIKECWSK